MGKDLGVRIAQALKKSALTQKALAERIGLNEAAVSRYISGERDPKPETLANIATALHTTSDYLLGIERDGFDYPHVRRMIARNAGNLTPAEKRTLIEALFGEE